MNKILIYNNNLEIVKNFCNIIFNNFNNILLSGIATTEVELSALYNNNSQTNIIIIPYEELHTVNIHNLTNNIKYKIILCDPNLKYKNSKYNLYIPYNSSISYITKKVKHFISNVNERAIRIKTLKILSRFNFDFKLIGTKYLIEAIIYSYINKDNYIFENLEHKVFPYVANKYKASQENVKWSIIRSINIMNTHLNRLNLGNQYINWPDKITSKLLISEIVNLL